MIYIVVNAVQILVATIAGLAVGAAYHGLVRSNVPPRLGLGFLATALIAEFWLAAILAGAVLLAPAKADPWIMAVGSAVIIWVGFVVPALVVNLSYRGRPAGSVALDCGHWLAVMVVQAVVLKALGLTLPTA